MMGAAYGPCRWRERRENGYVRWMPGREKRTWPGIFGVIKKVYQNTKLKFVRETFRFSAK